MVEERVTKIAKDIRENWLRYIVEICVLLPIVWAAHSYYNELSTKRVLAERDSAIAEVASLQKQLLDIRASQIEAKSAIEQGKSTAQPEVKKADASSRPKTPPNVVANPVSGKTTSKSSAATPVVSGSDRAALSGQCAVAKSHLKALADFWEENRERLKLYENGYVPSIDASVVSFHASALAKALSAQSDLENYFYSSANVETRKIAPYIGHATRILGAKCPTK